MNIRDVVSLVGELKSMTGDDALLTIIQTTWTVWTAQNNIITLLLDTVPGGGLAHDCTSYCHMATQANTASSNRKSMVLSGYFGALIVA